MDLVVNSYHFLRDILPATLQKLNGQEIESPLLQAVADNGHRILVTDRGTRDSVKNQYAMEAIKQGLGPRLVVVLDQLEAEGIVAIDPHVARRSIPNMRRPHKVFIEDAVSSGVRCFVTEYAPWLALNRDRQICPALTIVNANGFIRMANRNRR